MLSFAPALLALLLAAGFDWRRREIPDAIPLLLLAAAGVGSALGTTSVTWLGLLVGLGGGVALGCLGFATGVFGGGDAKLIAALGAAVGPAVLALTLGFGAIAAGVLAWRARQRGERELPFAPALAVGFAACLLLGGGRLLAPGR